MRLTGHREIADDRKMLRIGPFDFRADEAHVRIRCYIEEMRRAQVAVAVVVMGIDLRDVEIGLHRYRNLIAAR